MQLFIWAPLIAVGWYMYFTSSSQSGWYLMGLLAATTVLAFGVRAGIRNTAAADNVVAAAATFNTLSESDRQRVHDRAIEIIRESGWRGKDSPSFRDDAERFGWYALAMDELGVAPVCVLRAWQHVSNPFIATTINSTYMNAALSIAKKQGFEVWLAAENP